MRRILSSIPLVLALVLGIACEEDSGSDTANGLSADLSHYDLDEGLAEAVEASPDLSENPPVCSHAASQYGPRVSVAFEEGTPPDHACPAWWRAGSALIDSVEAKELVFTFQPEGPQVTATLENAPHLTGGVFAPGDTLDAVAFHESCEGIIINDALVLWRSDGTVLFYAANQGSITNAHGWRDVCDPVHPCPRGSLQQDAEGCLMPDTDCSVGNRLVPVVLELDASESLVIEAGAVHTVVNDDVAWSVRSIGYKASTHGPCTEFSHDSVSVVALRRQ